MMTTPFSKSLLSLAITTALLTGCGGGGGGSSSPSSTGSAPSSGNQSAATPTVVAAPVAPVVAIGFGLKQLQFSWPAVSGATFYRVLESADGAGAFTQIGGDLTATGYSKDIAVHTHNWAAARYQVQACNSAGCTASSTLSASAGVLQAIGYFKASNTAAGDSFGWTLALSGDGATMAVGAPFEDSAATGINGTQTSDAAADSGAVYLYAKGANGWTQQAYIKASNTLANANFGISVALNDDGSTLAVGAPFEDGAATAINGSQATQTTSDAGAIYVFTRSAGGWTQQAYVKPTNNYADNYFGWALALSDDGNTLVGGAPGESNSASGINPATTSHSAANAGAAYVFTRSSGSWSQQAYVKASNTAADDNFGSAVALSGTGTTLAVSAPLEASSGTQTDNSSIGAGAVYVFARASSWSQQAYLKASNSGTQDNFGATLALNDAGDTLAVGAPYEASNAVGVNGSQGNDSAANAGAVYVFGRASSSWSQQAYVKASNTNTNDNFGAAVALNGTGTVLAVGAIGESSNATGVDGVQTDNSKDGVGATYLFNRSGTSWAQGLYLKPSTATLGNEFGSAIGLSDDATTLAISGAFEQSNALGIGGSQTSTSAVDAGALWLF